MKITLTALIILLFAVFASAQVTIDNFDNSAADVYELSTEGPPSEMILSNNTTDFKEGSGSLDANVVIGAFHQWGSYAQLIYRTDSTDVLDWSISDSLQMWIKVRVPPSIPANFVLRIHIADRPTPDSPIEEYIYEHPTVLDAANGWVHLKIPLYERPQPGTDIPDSTGFILAPTSWGGFSYNNSVLDRDKIVGYNIGFITTGWDPAVNLPQDSIKVTLDGFERYGTRAVPYIFFNGKVLSNFMSQFTWGQSQVFVEEGTGSAAGKNSLKWIQGNEWGNGWTGAGYNISPALNMAGSWVHDSLKFKMKCPTGTGNLRMQFESPNGKVGSVFTPVADGQWHEYALPLNQMVLQDGTTSFDSSNVTVFQFMAEASGVAGTEIYFDDIWTGNPSIDVVAPLAVTNVSASAGTFLNTIVWDDVPGETGEVYNIYYSVNPITDITAAGVEVVKLKVAENNGLVDHVLIAPQTTQNVSYYYAVTCVDAAGNESDITGTGAPLTNSAKGVTIISPTAPVNFAADGDLSDWAGITPFRMFVSDGSGHVVTNTSISGDADLSVLAYVAMDNDNLYVAFDVVDDIVYTDTVQASYLIDSPDLYIGLYNWHGAPHTSYQRGAEPDYHFRFGRRALLLDSSPGGTLMQQGNANYYWEEKFTPGYIVEAKMPLSDIAALGGDDLFVPVIGKRIPIDFSANDADATGSREGILTYSPNNEDLSYQDVSRWSYTWIGDQWTGVDDEEIAAANDYSLYQNYPNPFNPSTTIQYTLKNNSFVTLKIYDVLGSEVAVLVNGPQDAGLHTVKFDASKLSTGIYFYRLDAGSFTKVNKMLLLK